MRASSSSPIASLSRRFAAVRATATGMPAVSVRWMPLVADSDGSRAGVPIEAEQRFRGKPTTPGLHDALPRAQATWITLELLWQEHRQARPECGYGYSRFCDLYREWRGQLDLVMRKEHRAGEKLRRIPGRRRPWPPTRRPKLFDRKQGCDPIPQLVA